MNDNIFIVLILNDTWFGNIPLSMQMSHANVHYHHLMDILVHALALYLLVTVSNIIVIVTPTTWLVIPVGLVKEMVPGQEVTHLVFMVSLLLAKQI